jgi:hypothetical protein
MESAISYIKHPGVEERLQSRWYAACTRPHQEKKIFKQIEHENTEAYLPLAGVSGDLVDYAGKKCVIVHIDELCKSLMVNVINILKVAE